MKNNLTLQDISFILVFFGFLGYDSVCTIHKETWAFICLMGIIGFIASMVLWSLECIIGRKKRKKNGR
jgi:hypothetical protein